MWASPLCSTSFWARRSPSYPTSPRRRETESWNQEPPRGQIVFWDTPGIHRARSKLNQSMVKVALGTYKEVDGICFIIEANRPFDDENDFILETLKNVEKPVLLVINKIDLIPKPELLPSWTSIPACALLNGSFPSPPFGGRGWKSSWPRCSKFFPWDPDSSRGHDHRPAGTFPGRRADPGKSSSSAPRRGPLCYGRGGRRFKEREEKNLIFIKATIQVERQSQKES